MAHIFKSIKRENCPKCFKTSSAAHCKSPSCGWFICFHCTAKPDVRIFDNKKHSFLMREK